MERDLVMRFLCLVLVALVLAAGCAKLPAKRTLRPTSGPQTAPSAPVIEGTIAQTGPAPLPAAPAPAVQPENQASGAPAPPPRTEKSWPVEGNGETMEKARSDAWRRADDALHIYLK